MKLISWNVNGLRACIGKGLLEFWQRQQPDVFCIQETKMQPEQANFDLPQGYYAYWNSAEKKGYSGTAVFTRVQPLSVHYGIDKEEHSHEGRAITVEFEDFYVVNVYVPNSQRELMRLPYRTQWEDDVRTYLSGLKKKKPVIYCGDLNVAHRDIDVCNPKLNQGSAGFSPQEREKLTQLLGIGLVDTFRYLYPDRGDAYTWWNYMYKARATNAGWRIDYFLADSRLALKIEDALIYSDTLGSDHCPVGLILE